MGIRTCDQGHTYSKTSDCPTCPVCERERKPEDSFLGKINAPARRALERENILTLEKLSSYREQEILQLHGMGKSTIPKLRQMLGEVGLSFKKNQEQQ